MYHEELAVIGRRIEDLRKGKGWTQEMLAEKLNVSRNTVTKLEGGFRDFKSTEIGDIARVLRVSTDFLLGLSPSMSLDADVQAIANKTGLSDAAIAEFARLSAEYAVPEKLESIMKKIADWGVFKNAFEAGILKTPMPERVTAEEHDVYMGYMQNETDKMILGMINCLLSSTAGLCVLSSIARFYAVKQDEEILIPDKDHPGNHHVMKEREISSMYSGTVVRAMKEHRDALRVATGEV